jgi:glycosyltransferase involved in cell wall biosynthesis
LKPLEENYISVVVTVRNCGNALIGRLEQMIAEIKDTFRHYEVIVVDNYSTDTTADALHQCALPISVVTLAKLHNTQAALTAGVEIAIGDYIVEIPDIRAEFPADSITKLYRVCQQGSDFVFLTPTKISRGSRTFYGILNRYYNGEVSEQFTSSIMTLSSRRGQNKTADISHKLVNRNVSYVLTGLKCATVPIDINNKNSRSFRENVNLMLDTLIYHTDYISGLAVKFSVFLFVVTVLFIIFSFVMYFVMSTAPGWASTFVLISLSFSALFVILAIVCKYLSHILNTQTNKNYIFRSVEKKSIDK